MANIAKEEKLNLVGVPYKGDSDQIPALLGGHIPIGTPGFASIQSLFEAKKVKVLAVLNEKRVDLAPDIPTVVELGYKLPFEAFTGLFGPRGTPDGVAKKINEVARKISEDEDYQNKIKKLIVQVTYEDTAPFEKSLVRLKKNLETFFKEEGLVKK
jgi:tripartite-type tricarboxylate transporter receptor subunit TctC